MFNELKDCNAVTHANTKNPYLKYKKGLEKYVKDSKPKKKNWIQRNGLNVVVKPLVVAIIGIGVYYAKLQIDKDQKQSNQDKPLLNKELVIQDSLQLKDSL